MNAIKLTSKTIPKFKELLEKILEQNSKLKGEDCKNFVKRMNVLKPIDREIRKYGLQTIHEQTQKGIKKTVDHILKDLKDGKIRGGYCNEHDLGNNENFGKMPQYAEIHGSKTKIPINSKSWLDNSEHAISIRKAQKYWNEGYCEVMPL